MKISKVNGYKLAFHKKESTEIVNIRFWVRVGSSVESKNQYGIAHFLEHMIFKGTPTRTAKEISAEADSFGGSLNAGTSFDFTVYHITALRKYFNEAFGLLADIFLNSTMPEEELEKERGVVLDEIGRSEDDPDAYLYRRIAKELLSEDVGHSILGSTEVIKNVTKEDLLKFKERFYCGDNILISIVGNLEEDQVEEVIKKNFIDFKEFKKINRDKAEVNTGKEIIIQKPGISETQYVLYYPGISVLHEDKIKLGMMSFVLGGASSSYLFERIREDLGLCYGIYSLEYCSDNFDVVEIATSANREHIDIIHKEIQKIIEMMKTEKIPEERLKIAKTKVLSSIEMGIETSAGYNLIMSSRILKGEEEDPIEKMRKQIEEVTVEDIQSMAQKTFKDKPIITILEPFEAKKE